MSCDTSLTVDAIHNGIQIIAKLIIQSDTVKAANENRNRRLPFHTDCTEANETVSAIHPFVPCRQLTYHYHDEASHIAIKIVVTQNVSLISR